MGYATSWGGSSGETMAAWPCGVSPVSQFLSSAERRSRSMAAAPVATTVRQCVKPRGSGAGRIGGKVGRRQKLLVGLS